MRPHHFCWFLLPLCGAFVHCGGKSNAPQSAAGQSSVSGAASSFSGADAGNSAAGNPAGGVADEGGSAAGAAGAADDCSEAVVDSACQTEGVMCGTHCGYSCACVRDGYGNLTWECGVGTCIR